MEAARPAQSKSRGVARPYLKGVFRAFGFGGFRVEGFGVRVLGLGFGGVELRVWGFGDRVWFRVLGWGFRV